MKKLMFFLMGMFLVFIVADSASATPVTFDVEGPNNSFVNLLSQDTGVDILWWTIGEDTSITATLNSALATMPSWSLGDNESTVIDFFDFTVDGTGLGSFDLAANLSFSSPDIDAGTTGEGGWGTVSWNFNFFGHHEGSLSGGIFNWQQDTFLTTLSDGNVVQIVLEDGFAIGLNNSTTVHATVTNFGGAPVPEPATMLLFGLGLVGLAGVSRKKLK